MPIKFLEDDEVAQPTVSDSVQIQQPTQQKKTIRFLDDNPPIQQAQPLSYTMGTDPEVDKHLDDTKAQCARYANFELSQYWHTCSLLIIASDNCFSCWLVSPRNAATIIGKS